MIYKTKQQIQTEAMEFLADLPEEQYMSAIICVRWKADNENGNSDSVGYTGPDEEYMQLMGALANNGARHGFLTKTIDLEP